MEQKINEIELNGIKYVPKDSVKDSNKVSTDGLKYVLIRAKNAGVFTGFLKSKNNQTVILLNARRLWYWNGAASLSQLSMEGVSKPNDCKFPIEVSEIEIEEVIETHYCTEKCYESIKSVKIWKA